SVKDAAHPLQPVRVGVAQGVIDDHRHSVTCRDQAGDGQTGEDAELLLRPAGQLVKGDAGAVQCPLADRQVLVDLDVEALAIDGLAQPPDLLLVGTHISTVGRLTVPAEGLPQLTRSASPTMHGVELLPELEERGQRDVIYLLTTL